MFGKGLKQGFYHTDLANTSWDIPVRYKRLTPVGNGAYGQVVGADDEETRSRVALKKLSRPFQSVIFAKRTLREIKMLQYLQHENLLNLLDIFTPNKTVSSFNEVYLVTPLMDTDLAEALKCQHLKDDHIQFLLYQILRGLKYIHSAGIIHRDLKPNNIGVNVNVELKILDFGLARSNAEEMTGYVVCRWYRAPEIILNWMHYNEKVDIWSVGCILGEMISRRPLFKGVDHIDQLKKILALVGKPQEDFIKKIASKDAQNYILSLPRYKRRDFKEYFEHSNDLAIDLLEKMLDLDPECRISVEDALQHPYMQCYHDPDDEPTAEPFDDSFEKEATDLNVDGLKKLVLQEINSFQRKPEPQSTDNDR